MGNYFSFNRIISMDKMACKWYVQKNVARGVDEKIHVVCSDLGIQSDSFNIIPFLDRMPRLGAVDPFVLIGSTTLNRIAWKSRKYRRGIFFDPSAFRPDQYLYHYKDRYFNADMRVVKIDDIQDTDYSLGEELFIRVNDDSKQISGGTLFFSDLLDIKEGSGDNYVGGDIFNHNCEVCLASVKPIEGEWRLVVVQGEIVAASGYRPVVDENVPAAVLDFGREMASIWTPHEVCVMDVCASNGQLYVLECNCFNASGFYAADLHDIVTAVSAYQTNRFAG